MIIWSNLKNTINFLLIQVFFISTSIGGEKGCLEDASKCATEIRFGSAGSRGLSLGAGLEIHDLAHAATGASSDYVPMSNFSSSIYINPQTFTLETDADRMCAQAEAVKCGGLSGISPAIAEMINFHQDYSKFQLVSSQMENVDFSNAGGGFTRDFSKLNLTSGLDFEVKDPFEQLRKNFGANSEYCDCLKTVLENRYPDINNFDSYFNKTLSQTPKVAKKLINSYGQKFINDLSANLENSAYYASTTSTIFEKGKYESCNSAEKFQAAIDAKCKSSSVSKDEQKRRMGMIFNSFPGLDFSAKSSLEEKLKTIGEMIHSIPLNEPDSGKSGVNTGARYSREQMDIERKLLMNDSEEVKFLDQMVSVVLKNKSYSEKVLGAISEGSKTLNIARTSPGIAIYTLLSDLYEKDRAKFEADFLNPKKLGEHLSAEMKEKLKKDPEKVLGQFFNTGTKFHPTLGILFDNGDVFKAAANKYKGTSSILKSVEHDDELIAGFFESNCEQIREEFSSMVCKDDMQIVGMLTPSELREYISRSQASFDEDIDIVKNVSCQTVAPELITDHPMAALVSGINASGLYRSDFVDGLRGESTLFERMREISKDKKFQQEIVARIEKNGDSISSLSGGNSVRSQILRNYGMSPESVATSVATNASAKTEVSTTGLSAPLQELAKSVDISQTAGLNQPMFNSVMNSQSVAFAKTTKTDDIRNEVKDFLSNRENKEEVDKLVSGADEKSLKELIRLREQALQDKEKLLELTNQQEKLKLADLERKIKELETKKAELANPEALADAATVSGSTSGSQQRSPASVSNYSADSYVPQSTRTNSTSFETSGASAGTSSVSSETSSSSGGAGRVSSGASSAANAIAAVGSGERVSSGQGTIIISAASDRVVGQEIKSNEVSQELMNYLSNNETDLSALQNLKSSGMVYRYRVLKNGQYIDKEIVVEYSKLTEEVKTLIDQKIARDREIASLDQQLQLAQRTYSFNALKMILGEQLRK